MVPGRQPSFSTGRSFIGLPLPVSGDEILKAGLKKSGSKKGFRGFAPGAAYA
jgi:hypothetical protein